MGQLTNQARSRGLFELSTLAEMFAGSATQMMVRTLPWFGKLSEHSSDEIFAWLEQLIARGLLAVNTSSRFRVPTLTSKGYLFLLTGVEELGDLGDKMTSLCTEIQKYRILKAKESNKRPYDVISMSNFQFL